jgi:GNAT superfamily N-acetyltransferase
MTELRKLKSEDIECVLPIIHGTTRKSYENYYPPEAIQYFLDYHSPENIIDDLKHGYGIGLYYKGKLVGTGILLGTNIRRVFVNPEFQGRGFGSKIMDCLENEGKKAGLDFLELHSSLPAKKFYDNRSYWTLRFGHIPVENSLTLDYYRMAKMLRQINSPTLYNFHEKTFRALLNDGPGAEVNRETIFTFFQSDEMVMGEYSGMSKSVIEKNSANKIRLIDTWQWKARTGEGRCILEEV